MNTINLNDSAFTNLDSNPIVFATMVSMMCLYLLLLIWARKKDKKDALLAGVSPLPDNDPRDKYLYEITLYTGSRKGAGTTAKVSFIITGDQDETSPRVVEDDKRPILARGGVDSFVMAVPRPLGNLTHLRIWHDNMGSSPSWYFSRFMLRDMQTGHKYFFICEEWLSFDCDDGLIDRVIPIAGKAELTNFSFLFWSKAKTNLTDSHIWFSVFKRPAKSNFTRVQRLTCCLSLIFCSMCASIAWYGTAADSSEEVKVGPVGISLAGVYIGIVSSAMTLPINILIVMIFRYSRPPPTTNTVKEEEIRKKSSDDDDDDCKKSKTKAWWEDDQNDEEEDYFVEEELKDQKEYLETGNVHKRNLTKPGEVKEEDLGLVQVANIPLPKDLAERKKKKGSRRLPHWCVYIGYAICFCTVSVTFWLTVEIAGVFGKNKSLEWLISFFISAFESIFFSQPLKVLALSIFYALVIKKPDTGGDDDPGNDLKTDEEWLHKHLTEKDLLNPDTLRMLENRKDNAPLPPELDFLRTAKAEREKERQMHQIIREVVVCFTYLFLILLLAYTNRDLWSYRMQVTYNNIFNHGDFEKALSGTKQEFNLISRYEDFWNWTENVLVNGLYDREYYNGEIYTEPLIADRQTILVGGARLRQVRIKSDMCDTPMNYIQFNCEKSYSIMREDQDHYLPGWEPVDLTVWSQVPHTYFTYRDWEELDGYPYMGLFATYGGGGYVAELGTDSFTAKDVIQFLHNSSWIDSNTRAVVVEFNLYNPNLNLWGVCMYLIEFLQTGGLEMSPKWHILRLDRYAGAFMYFVMAMEFITVMFVIYFTVREIRQFKARKLQYFKDFWNWWELVCLALVYAIIILFIYRTVVNIGKMNDVHSNPNAFTNLHYSVLLDELCGYMIAFLVYMYTIRFIRLLRFNKKISVLGDTLMHVGKPIVSFLVVFIVAFCAFAMMAYVFFGRNLHTFRNFVTTLETLISMMLNKFDYASMMAETKIIGPVMFGFFCLIFNIVLINFFITVILEGFTAVRNDENKQSNEYEIVDFIIRRTRMTLGIGQPKKRNTKRAQGLMSDPKKDQFVYIEKLTPEMERIAELDGKVNTMINKLEELTDVKQEQEEFKEELEKFKRKKIVIG